MSATVDRARQARELFRTHRSGVLSSHSAKLTGYPYGSALPHIADHVGRPVVLISHLAEHTHNLIADPRASFLVSDTGPDMQVSARAAMLGDAQRVTDPHSIRGRYLRFFPQQAAYLDLGGFEFWTIEPRQIRLIEGFGSLHWIAGERYLAAAAEIAEIEGSLLEHMNTDHHDALLAYCQHRYGIGEPVEMVGFDCDGFDIRANARLLRFPLPEPVTTAAQARAALIALAQQSRS